MLWLWFFLYMLHRTDLFSSTNLYFRWDSESFLVSVEGKMIKTNFSVQVTAHIYEL